MKIKNIILIFLIVSLIGFGIFFYYIKNRATPEKSNIIIISIDTLRADHLGTYGYKKDTSPNIDALAKKSIVFENAFSPAPWTIPSYASLFTGVYPLKHRVFTKELNEKFPTMAEVLKENGYKTAAFISSQMLSQRSNEIGRGFDLYDEVDEKDFEESLSDDAYKADRVEWWESSKYNAQRARRVTNKASEWLRRNKDKKFFLFLHYFDPHPLYEAPEPFKNKFSSQFPDDIKQGLENAMAQKRALSYSYLNLTDEDIEYLKARYDEEIAYTDYYIGELFKKIDSLKIDKNTIIVITADHGEGFDHDYFNHGYRLYDSAVKIPLIIYDPLKKERAIIKEPVSLIDILPTLMSRLGIDRKFDTDGIDLIPLLNGGEIERNIVFSMSLPALPDRNTEDLKRSKYTGQLYAGITQGGRLIYNENSGQKEFYNIMKDPEQLNNTYGENNKESAELLEKLILWLSQNKSIDNENLKIKNKELYDTLKSYGYL